MVMAETVAVAVSGSVGGVGPGLGMQPGGGGRVEVDVDSSRLSIPSNVHKYVCMYEDVSAFKTLSLCMYVGMYAWKFKKTLSFLAHYLIIFYVVYMHALMYV